MSAAFKYLMATVLASTFFLIGTMLLYAATGMLNIDDLIAQRQPIAGPIGFAALMFLLACLLLELKPFPANGWGLDVYETARSDVAALISGGVSAGVFFALLKLMPLFDGELELIAALSAVTFLFSNLIGLRQTKTQRLLGYSSIGQMALMTLAAAFCKRLQAENLFCTWWSEACSSITCSPRLGCSGWRAMSTESAWWTGRGCLDSPQQSCCLAFCWLRSADFHHSRVSGRSGNSS